MSSCCGGPLRCPGLGSKVRLSTRPPALPVGKGAGRCAPWSPRRFFLQGHFGCAADRSPLHCPGLGSKVRLSPHPPALPVGKGAGRCAPWSPRRFFLYGHFGCAADRSPLHCPGLGSKVRLSPHPPALPVGKGAGRCAPWSPGVFSSRGILGVRRTGLRCIVLVWAPRCVCLPIPPPFPWGRGLVAALRCGHWWVLLPGFLLPCVSGLWCRPSCRRYAGGRAGSVPVRAAVPGFPSPHALFL